MATAKQEATFRDQLENPGKALSKSMRENGFKPGMAKNPQDLKKTKGWQELTDKFLNDKELMKKHNEQLNSSRMTKMYFDIDDSDSDIRKVCKELGVELLYVKLNKDKTGKTVNVKAPDFFYRDLALDKAYKLKGKYSAEKKELSIPQGDLDILKEVLQSLRD